MNTYKNHSCSLVSLVVKKNKNSISHKPDSVFIASSLQQRPSFILLQHYCYNLAAYPPLRTPKRTANEPPASLLGAEVYVALQHTKFTHLHYY
jgi:hypothetical protein